MQQALSSSQTPISSSVCTTTLKGLLLVQYMPVLCISWSSLGGLKRVKPPEAFGERSRDWSLGHAGDEGPHLAMTGESWGCSRAAAPVCAFSRGTTARSVSLSWGAREVGSPCEWRGRAPHCSRAMVGCRGPAPADPGYSKERRRRRRSGNHCLIKC